MEEKKLTDEEIVKALECCAVEPCEDCGNCPRFTKEKLCHKANAKQSLDLIHRLQNENERLKNAYREGLEQGKFDSQVKILELQKQVYEFNKSYERSLVFERRTIRKDTAKEILQGLIEKAYVNECIDLTVAEVKAWFREDYGVEVE